MIQANEIRVGCTFLHKKEWSYRQDEKDLNSFYFNWAESDWYALGECTLSLEVVGPIPLTEDILLKCEFSKEIDDLVLETKHILFISYNDDEFVHIKNNALDTIISIKYLHQLQNAYFALTQQELNIQL